MYAVTDRREHCDAGLALVEGYSTELVQHEYLVLRTRHTSNRLTNLGADSHRAERLRNGSDMLTSNGTGQASALGLIGLTLRSSTSARAFAPTRTSHRAVERFMACVCPLGQFEIGELARDDVLDHLLNRLGAARSSNKHSLGAARDL